MVHFYSTLRFFALLVLVLLFATSCEKDSDEPNLPDDQEEETLEDLAEYNDGVLSGAGNIFISKQLSTGALSHLLAKQVYQQDTLIYFATIDHAAAVETLHTIAYASNGSSSVTVSEVVPSQGFIRIYSIDKGTKNRLVLSLQQHAENEVELRLLDYDWSDHSASVITSIYLRNGVRVGNYTAPKSMSLSANSSINANSCNKPSPSTNIASALDDQTAYFRCLIGALEDESFESIATNLKSVDGYEAALNTVNSYREELSKLNASLSKVSGKFKDFKSTTIPENDSYKSLQDLYKSAGTQQTGGIELSFVADASNLTWDDSDITRPLELTLEIIDQASNQPKLGLPVYVDIRLSKGEDIMLEQTQVANPQSGRVKFIYNPSSEQVNFNSEDKLTIAYRLSTGEWQDASQQSILVADNVPAKLEIVSGNNQEGSWNTLLSQVIRVKVSNQAGKALAKQKVRWTAVNSGSLSDAESMSNVEGIAETQWTTGDSRSKRSQVRAQVIGKNGQALEDLTVLFQYKQIRSQPYSLGIVEYSSEDYGSPANRVVQIWKDGDKITVPNNVMFTYRLIRDGKEVLGPNGLPMESMFNSATIGVPYGQYQPFQERDVRVPNYYYHFPNPTDGSTDSIHLDVTLSNEVYRRIVGSTLRIEGNPNPAPPGWTDNHNVGEVVTYTFHDNGKFSYSSAKNPALNGSYDFNPHPTYTEVPITSCDDKVTMKKVIGLLSFSGPHTGFAGLLLFEDNTVEVLNSGTGFNRCLFDIYWRNKALR